MLKRIQKIINIGKFANCQCPGCKFKKETIIWIELTDKGRFVYSNEEIYLLNSAYFLIPPKHLKAKYLLAILNSKLINFYLNIIAETSGMGTNRWINNYIKEFPLPRVENQQVLLFTKKL